MNGFLSLSLSRLFRLSGSKLGKVDRPICRRPCTRADIRIGDPRTRTNGCRSPFPSVIELLYHPAFMGTRCLDLGLPLQNRVGIQVTNGIQLGPVATGCAWAVRAQTSRPSGLWLGWREAHGARMQVRVRDALRVRHDVVRGVEGAEADRAAGRARAHAHAQVGKRRVDALELADKLGVIVVEAQREGVVTEVGSMLRVCLSCACLPHRCAETLLPPKPNELLVGVGRSMVGVMRVKMVALVPHEPSSMSSAA